MSSEFWTAIVTLVTTLVVTFGSWFIKRFLDRRQSQKRDLQDFLQEIGRLNIIQNELAEMMSKTRVDRFLILRAENGVSDPQYATAIYIYHNKFSVPTYHKIRIDDEYRKMLRDAEATQVYRMHTEQMPLCLLRNIYMSEGVKHANCYFLGRKEFEGGRAILTYCTMATHGDGDFQIEDEVAMLRFVGMLRDMVFSSAAALVVEGQMS